MNFMRRALDLAHIALDNGEVPVGCVFVKNNEIIAEGYNLTNQLKNGTKHCEFIAVESILKSNSSSILEDSELYVTCEPCIMCAEFLTIIKVSKVFFGCYNEKFGGNGSILSLHSG